MRRKRAVGTLAVAVLALVWVQAAEAQLAKQGTYGGLYGWTVSSTVQQLEEGHVYTQDLYRGTFFNDAGEGFLHESSWVCFGISDVADEAGDASGYCVMTDTADDTAFAVWEGRIDPSIGFTGQFQWTGGTGKYAGMTGNNTFEALVIGSSSEGRGLITGEWQLP
jgi:hypothetical protein